MRSWISGRAAVAAPVPLTAGYLGTVEPPVVSEGVPYGLHLRDYGGQSEGSLTIHASEAGLYRLYLGTPHLCVALYERGLQARLDSSCANQTDASSRQSVPPDLYKPETIPRFRGRLRDAFLSGHRATARVYLQNLVGHIVISEDEIVIEARAGAALAMMAGTPASRSEATAGEVLADVVD